MHQGGAPALTAGPVAARRLAGGVIVVGALSLLLPAVWRRPGGRWAWVVALAAMVVVLTPWTVRNWITFDRFVLVSTDSGAVVGGAVGNVIDRLRFGAVTDFIDLHWGEAHWPTFNLADAAIVCGVALLLLTVRGSDSRAASSTLGRAAR